MLCSYAMMLRSTVSGISVDGAAGEQALRYPPPTLLGCFYLGVRPRLLVVSPFTRLFALRGYRRTSFLCDGRLALKAEREWTARCAVRPSVLCARHAVSGTDLAYGNVMRHPVRTAMRSLVRYCHRVWCCYAVSDSDIAYGMSDTSGTDSGSDAIRREEEFAREAAEYQREVERLRALAGGAGAERERKQVEELKGRVEEERALGISSPSCLNASWSYVMSV
eukprot:429909-Rhodomonas_salina.3